MAADGAGEKEKARLQTCLPRHCWTLRSVVRCVTDIATTTMPYVQGMCTCAPAEEKTEDNDKEDAAARQRLEVALPPLPPFLQLSKLRLRQPTKGSKQKSGSNWGTLTWISKRSHE